MTDVMEIEIRGGPYDGATIWVQKNAHGLPMLGGAIGVYTGAPIHRDHDTGILYVYWEDIEGEYTHYWEDDDHNDYSEPDEGPF